MLTLSPRRSYKLLSNPTLPFISFFPPLTSSVVNYRTLTTKPNPNPNSNPQNPFLLNYLIQYFEFPKPRALSISNHYTWIKTSKKPQSVVQYFKHLGFSDAHIRSSVLLAPPILFSDVDKILKPKLQLFQELGLTGSDLGKFVSKNSSLLLYSLKRKLKPRLQILKKIFINDHNNEDLIRLIQRSILVFTKCTDSRLLSNVSYLESCGIVGSRLSFLLKKQPWLFVMPESDLRDLVSRVLDMGFLIGSRMLLHALYSVCSISRETFARKVELFRSFGFSEDERVKMFRSTPFLLCVSEEKLKVGIEFFLNTVKLQKIVFVRQPGCLMFSMEKRVIPRYKVLQIIKSKRLVENEPSFMYLLGLTEKGFLDKFIPRFRDNAEELLVAYKGHLLNSSAE